MAKSKKRADPTYGFKSTYFRLETLIGYHFTDLFLGLATLCLPSQAPHPYLPSNYPPNNTDLAASCQPGFIANCSTAKLADIVRISGLQSYIIVQEDGEVKAGGVFADEELASVLKGIFAAVERDGGVGKVYGVMKKLGDMYIEFKEGGEREGMWVGPEEDLLGVRELRVVARGEGCWDGRESLI